MKTNATQQEILLVTGTHFSSQQICPKDEKSADTSSLTEAEQLEQACWNGLLTEMLPEICEQTSEGKSLFLWDIKEGASFISLDLAEHPTPKDKHFSIDPYVFLNAQLLS